MSFDEEEAEESGGEGQGLLTADEAAEAAADADASDTDDAELICRVLMLRDAGTEFGNWTTLRA
jgi:hypothetical protein